jgi:ubiquinone/menaquinone biosynthesis C-methylase UbiE
MMNKIFLLLYILSFTLCLHAMEHKKTGTCYGNTGVLAYEKSRHGDDGAIFLDPYFMPYLEDVSDKKILDAGCGAGTWSKYAAQNGGEVFGIDIQQKMIERAREACKEYDFYEKCQFVVGSVAKLPYQENFFDRAIGIFVSCNLPSDIMEAHIREMYRTLKDGGMAVLTAPIELDQVFAENREKIKIKNHIDEVLTKINSHIDPRSQASFLGELTEIYRASFVMQDGKLINVGKNSSIANSTEIYRKIPGLVVPNFFHTEKEHKELIKKAGFHIVEIKKPHFSDENEWKEYNKNHQKTLSKKYLKRSPFIIFVLKKVIG